MSGIRTLVVIGTDNIAGGLLAPEGIIRLVVSASALAWLIIYIYYSKLFLNKVIINRTKVLLPQALVTLADFGYHVYALWFYCCENFKLFGFSIFRF